MSTKPLQGSLSVPGDKSISQRCLVLASLADGVSRVGGLPAAGDVGAMERCLRLLGSRISGEAPELEIQGGLLTEPEDVLDVGNSGTAIRCLTGLCAGLQGSFSVLSGDASIRSRPMLRVVAPLREMGASIWGADHGNRAPIAVAGSRLTGIDRSLDISSAQVKTALILAGLSAEGSTSISTPGPVRDHTERILDALGAPLEVSENRTTVLRAWAPDPFEVEVPGDLSSAMYLIAAALLVKNSELTVEGLGLNPTRMGALEVLKSMGADIEWTVDRHELGEPVGSVRASYSPHLHGIEVSGSELVPTLIDEIPVLAVLAAVAEGTTVFRDAAELRVKESDRIETVTAALTSLGVATESSSDGFVVHGGEGFHGGVVDPRGDHRIALSFAVAGLVARSKVRVEGWGATASSFPNFLDLVAQATAGRRR